MADAANDVNADNCGDTEATIPEEEVQHNKDTYLVNKKVCPGSTPDKMCSVEFQCDEGGFWMARGDNIEKALADICSNCPVWKDFIVMVDPKIDPHRFVKIMVPCVFLPFALAGQFDIKKVSRSGPNIRLLRSSDLFGRKGGNNSTLAGISKVSSIKISFAAHSLTGEETLWDPLLPALAELPNLGRTDLQLPENKLLSIQGLLATSEMSILRVEGKEGVGVYSTISTGFWNQLATRASNTKRKREIGAPAPVLLGNIGSLTLNDCQLSHDGWLALCKWLHESKSIYSVTLQSCRIETEDNSAENDVCQWDPLVDVFRYNHNLSSMFLALEFDGVPPKLTPGWAERAHRALCQNYSLSYLILPPLTLPSSVRIRLDMNLCRLSSLTLLASSSPSQNKMIYRNSARQKLGDSLINASSNLYQLLQHGQDTPHPVLDCLFVLFHECPHLVQFLPTHGWGN